MNVPHYVLQVYERLSCLTGTVLPGTCGRDCVSSHGNSPTSLGIGRAENMGKLSQGHKQVLQSIFIEAVEI